MGIIGCIYVYIHIYMGYIGTRMGKNMETTLGFGVQGLNLCSFVYPKLPCKIWGLGLRVWGLGLGFRVYGCLRKGYM